MQSGFGKAGVSGWCGQPSRQLPAFWHLRYAAVNAPFGRLYFPEAAREPTLEFGPDAQGTEKAMTWDGTAP